MRNLVKTEPVLKVKDEESFMLIRKDRKDRLYEVMFVN